MVHSNPATSPRAIALGGFMGVGKTTVGKALAERIGVPFVDTDVQLAREWGPIADQFANDGELVFRQRERAVIAALCDGTPRVVSTGGGAWADPRNRDALRTAYRLVVLHAPLALIRARLGEGEGRPNWERAQALFAAREAAYLDAELRLDASKAVVELVEELVVWLE